MSIKILNGDLLESDVDFICHQVNCMGAMNSGIAKSIREKWPVVYNEYYKLFKLTNNKSDLLGDVLFVDVGNKKIANMFSQHYYGYDGGKYTSYDAFWDCLEVIKDSIPKGSRIGFPYKVGCVRGGASWKIIYSMIEEILSEDFDVCIYKL